MNALSQQFKWILGSGLNSSNTSFGKRIFLGIFNESIDMTFDDIKNRETKGIVGVFGKFGKIKICRNILPSESDVPDIVRNVNGVDVGFKYLTSDNYDTFETILLSTDPSIGFDDTHKFFIVFEADIDIQKILDDGYIDSINNFFVFMMKSDYDYTKFDLDVDGNPYTTIKLSPEFEIIPISLENLQQRIDLTTVSNTHIKYCGLYEL